MTNDLENPKTVQQVGFVGLQLYREGKLYSSQLTLFKYLYLVIMFPHEHFIKHASLSRIVNEVEPERVDQAPEEGQPPVEFGFDICGTSEEPDYPVNQGKPRMH